MKQERSDRVVGIRAENPLTRVIAIILWSVCMSVTSAGQSGPSESSERLGRLEESLSRLEARIAELSELLRAALPPPPVTEMSSTRIDISKNPTRGNADASIAMIGYSDFECPYCGRYVGGAEREIQARFIATGKVRYVFRHLPLEELHPRARKSAEAAECAGEQGKFWEYHDRLFANQRALTASDLKSHAEAVGLSVQAFDSCMIDGRAATKVAADLAEAKALGLTGTPVFIIGEIQKDGSVKAGRKIVGSHPFPVYEAVLNEMLSRVGAK